MTTNIRACAIVALLAAAACDHTTSVGAAGGHRDAHVSDEAGTVDADAATAAANLCTSSGGVVATSICCANIDSFPDGCLIGACGCAPSNGHSIPVCNCPVGCFAAGIGCVGQQGACTVGMDLSCNEDTTLTSARGRCVTGSRCVCAPGASLSSAGKCL